MNLFEKHKYKAVGVDIVDNSKIQKMYNTHKSTLISKVLTLKERKILDDYVTKARKIEFISRRFAAKEAIVKALKTGICKKYNFLNIAVLNSNTGVPQVYINNQFIEEIKISLSSSANSSIAFCIIENNIISSK